MVEKTPTTNPSRFTGVKPESKVTVLSRYDSNSVSLMSYLIAGLVVTLVVMAVLVYRLAAIKAQDKELTVSLDQLKSHYQTLQSTEEQVQLISQIVKSLEAADAAQVPYDQVLQLLERTSFIPARYNSVSITAEGKVLLAGSVTTYNDFAKVVKAFRGSGSDNDNQDSLTDEVKVSTVAQSVLAADESGSGPQKTTEFNLQFNIRKELFGQPAISLESPAGSPTENAINSTQ